MQFLQLCLVCLARRAHEQVFCLLVHREHGDLAQIFRTAKQHDDAVDAGSHAAMWWRAILERAVETTETLFDGRLIETGNLEGLDHGFQQMVADAA